MKKLDQRLEEFLDYMTDAMGRPERRRALAWYLTGLLLDGGRKTCVSMAGRLVDDENEIEAMRQRLQQCVTISSWADSELRRRLALKLEKVVQPEAFVIDDTGFPKKGNRSVGVARQYSGTLGRVDNCQVATSLHIASDDTSGCIGMQLYLPEDWASDIKRRRAVGIPDEVVFKRKWQLAIDLLDEALEWGLPPRVVLADSDYGKNTQFRDALTERGCDYVVGIPAERICWPPGSRPRKPKRKPGQVGRTPTRYRDGKRTPRQIGEIGKSLAFRTFQCPDGLGGKKSGRFAFARVHIAEKHTKGRPPSDELWLICEHRPSNDVYKFYVSNLPATTAKRELVRLVKLRWRVERDYQELKTHVGLDHFEGRTWRGFHHHVTLCAVAHGFLAIERRLFPPEEISLDRADGAPTNPGTASGARRLLSTLPPDVRPGDSRSGTVADVIR